jgi:hypothetical protein
VFYVLLPPLQNHQNNNNNNNLFDHYHYYYYFSTSKLANPHCSNAYIKPLLLSLDLLSLSPPPLGGASADFTAQLYRRLRVGDSRDLSLSLSLSLSLPPSFTAACLLLIPGISLSLSLCVQM